MIPGGPFVMGTDAEPWAYDNERPAHVVDLPAFRIDAGPVTNGRYLEFVLDGGYDRPVWWAAEGWAWRQEDDIRHPQFWVDEGAGDWSRVRFGLREDLPLDEPVQHVCWYEADAYARWAGKRLPTEAEWEKAASWAPDGVKRRCPWGDEAPTADGRLANLGRPLFRPAPVGAYPDGASAYGCHQMIGDVWEWTSSDFEPYPGFASFPYREYSEVFFGPAYKVLRGGSWATSPLAVRTTFRNWDYPIRRQIFAGFRCARSAAEHGDAGLSRCAASSATSGPRSPWRRSCSIPRTRCNARRGRRDTNGWGRSTPTGSGWGGTTTGGGRSRLCTAPLGPSGPTGPSPAWPGW